MIFFVCLAFFFCRHCFTSDIHLLKCKLCFMPQINELPSRWEVSIDNVPSNLVPYGN